MNWTKMADHLGGYAAINSCNGQWIRVRVWKTESKTPWPWNVDLDGNTVECKRTCKEAKRAAVDIVMARRKELEGKPLIDVIE